MQEDHDVADKWLRHLLPKYNLDVAPHELVGQPERNPERHQAPEKTGSPMIVCDVRQQRSESGEQQDALGYVTENGEGESRRDQYRRAHLREDKAACGQDPELGAF
jgi:hypothetical protein